MGLYTAAAPRGTVFCLNKARGRAAKIGGGFKIAPSAVQKAVNNEDMSRTPALRLACTGTFKLRCYLHKD